MLSPSCSVAILLQKPVDSSDVRLTSGDHAFLKPPEDRDGMDSELLAQLLVAEAVLCFDPFEF